MYAVGREHSHKQRSLSLLRRVVEGEVEAALDTEVLQEILLRYPALNRWHEGRETYDLARQVFLRTFPITVEALDRARALLLPEEGKQMWRGLGRSLLFWRARGPEIPPED